MKKIVNVGNIPLGDGNVYIQSMTNTDTKDTVSTLSQIIALHVAGASLVRVSVPDEESAKSLAFVTEKSPMPIIADIHFSARPALIAIENGVKKIRVNPYNLSDGDLNAVVKKCMEYDVPIRVGVNNGSSQFGRTPAELAESALSCAKRIEDAGWDKIVLAVKTSDVRDTVEAYRILSEKTQYPLHVGLTEAGTKESGFLKSSVAIGSLLLDGIGDTIRVSLAGDPVQEVYAAKKILRAVGIDKNYAEIVACPTCARTCIDVQGVAERLEEATKDVTIPLKIAVMGCVVNGIGESKGADFGVAGGKGKSVIFSDGKPLATVPNEEIEGYLMKLLEERKNG